MNRRPAEQDERRELLLMAFADGELAEGSAEQAEVLALLAASPAVEAQIQGVQTMALALRQAALAEPTLSKRQLDGLALVEGRVLSGLGPAATAPAAEPARGAGLWALLDRLGWGRLWLGLGAAAAAAALALALPRAPAPPAMARVEAGLAAQHGGEALPDVIIEEMEIDSGTIVVDPVEDEDDGPVIIWHLDQAPAPEPGSAG
jgi:hypothetical protein